MHKLIITNQSSLSLDKVLLGLIEVIKMGRISGDCYCFVTTFESGYRIISMRNAKSDKFIIQENPHTIPKQLNLDLTQG